MQLRAIPFIFMRGGTSRGPYFLRSDLPTDRDVLAEVLMAVVGSGQPGNIDGIGGGTPVTAKVVILSRSEDPEVDVDYFFAQVSPDKREVDFAPSCGNMLAGVGPASIEMGLVEACDGVTTIRIRAVNTGALVEAVVQTPHGVVAYDGTTRIDGVLGTAAPIRLSFQNTVGSKTGALFPTGNRMEEIGGISVSCIDAAMPMVFARAADFGLTGYESKGELDANKAFFARMEAIRIEGGKRMGFGDVSHSVLPKFGLIAPPRGTGTVASRYFMPWSCHPTYAVTGAICLCACVLAPGTVASSVALRPTGSTAVLVIEHPAGVLELVAEYTVCGDDVDFKKLGTLRTARKLAAGTVFIPGDVWPDHVPTADDPKVVESRSPAIGASCLV
ncbi:4-oxalomesaconate tautomerase [Xanthobacteraceae bacterium Astr-EGSB]|uniref:4-oxalomesaconate tautomerase n=1 Tax=Astrobacterium formosum TaxID=3069710 RepID=UPI0027B5688D|nr:4-oxalomesaconate tautomerase [Xanthobacteraceae bacterium Astr-EGSB]